MGFKSGDLLVNARPSWVILAVCFWLLSSWNIHFLPLLHFLADEIKSSSNMTRYISPFTFPSMTCNAPVPLAEKQPILLLHYCNLFAFLLNVYLSPYQKNGEVCPAVSSPDQSLQIYKGACHPCRVWWSGFSKWGRFKAGFIWCLRVCEDWSSVGRPSWGSRAEPVKKHIQLVGSIQTAPLLTVFDAEACNLLHTNPSIQQILQVNGYPRLIIGKMAYSPGWDCGILTELDVNCDVVSNVIYIIPMGLAEHFLICSFKAVLQDFIGLQSPPPHSPCGDRLPLNCRNILWF